MATLAELQQADHRETALLLSIEDLPVAFTDNADLVGESILTNRTILPGLIPPDYVMEVDPKADWQLVRHTVDITIEDLRGLLGSYFGRTFDGTETPLALSVEPGDDLAASTDLHERHLGNEFVGPSGERNYYPLIDTARPRFHAGQDIQGGLNGVAPISEEPRILDGRRVALLQVWRDWTVSPSVWITDPVVRWWGTLRGSHQKIEDRRWTLLCDGQSSWLYRTLGQIAQSDPVELSTDLLLPAGAFCNARLKNLRQPGQAVSNAFGVSVQAAPSGLLTRAEVIAFVAGVIATAAAATGTNGEFVNNYSQQVAMGIGGGITISVEDNDAPNAWESWLELTMPVEYWHVIGYDPRLQRALAYDNEKYVRFEEPYLSGGLSVVRGFFTTAEPFIGQDATYDNDGAPRTYLPAYPFGATAIAANPAVFETYLRLGFDSVVHPGQLDQPIPSDPADPTAPIDVDGLDADAQGLWLIFGPRRFEGSEDVFTEIQVARCAWARLSGYAVGGDVPTVRVVKWEEPRAFGINRPKMTTPWLIPIADPDANLQAVPLYRLGLGTPDIEGEDADRLLARLLYTSGTSTGWSSYADDPTTAIVVGDNDPSSSAPLDADNVDVGLSVDQGFILDPDEWRVMDALGGPTVRKSSVNWIGQIESETVIRALCAFRGWGMGLAGGKYTPFVIDDLVPSTETIALGPSTKRTKLSQDRHEHRLKQTLFVLPPKDEYTLAYNRDPLTGTNTGSVTINSPDPGRPYRQTREDRGKSPGTQVQPAPSAIFEAEFQRAPGDWHVRARELAVWAAAGHFLVHDYPLQPQDLAPIFPGQRVTLDDPTLYNPATGAYGVSGVQGIVTRLNARRGGRDQTCDIFVDGRSLYTTRVHSPMAQGRGYDTSTRRLYCVDDCMGNGTGILDVQYFVEPEDLNLGGNAQLQVHQYDGADWTLTCYGPVQDVDATPGSSSIRLSSITGTYRRDDEAIITMRPLPLQDAPWVLAIIAPVSAADGTWSDGTVVPWSS